MVVETQYYDILSLTPGASGDEISRSYKKIALKCHPDKTNHDPQLTEKFKQVTRAYEVLKDEKSRLVYDKYGEAGLSGAVGESQGQSAQFRSATDVFSQVFNDINSMFMGDMQTGPFPGFGRQFPFESPQMRGFNMNFGSKSGPSAGRSASYVRGKDIHHTCQVALEDLVYGRRIKLRLPRKSKCEICQGVGGFDPRSCATCQGTGRSVITIVNQFSRFQEIGPCKDCYGSGTIISEKCTSCDDGYLVVNKILELLIEPGSKDGDKIILKGGADEGKNVIPGDVVVKIKQLPHPFLVRRLNDFYMEQDIDLKTALLGGWITIHDYIRKDNDLRIFINVHGNSVLNQQIHGSIQLGEVVGTINPGTPKIVKGLGVPINLNNGPYYQDGVAQSPDGSLGNTPRGDLFIKFNVKLPAVEQFKNGLSDLRTLAAILPDKEEDYSHSDRKVEEHNLSNLPVYSSQSPERSHTASSPDMEDVDHLNKKRRQ